MATKCNKDCPPCQTSKQDIYICLKSEREFLSSLLRLGQNNERKRNLLGFEPIELIDWYLYTKRSFSAWPSRDKLGSSIKLLDELSKILFGITQVTAKTSYNDSFILLRPAEQELLSSFLGGDFRVQDHQLRCRHLEEAGSGYTKAKTELLKRCDTAQAELYHANQEKYWRENYGRLLECRIAYTQIKEVAAFHWDSWDCDVYLIRCENALASTASLKLAAVYLHGVARFALFNKVETAEPTELGYWIEVSSGDEALSSQNISTATKYEGPYSEKYGQTPAGSTPQVRLACELAASFTQEYFKFSQIAPSSCDLLFMCKESSEKGWFWVFTDSQLRTLKANWKEKTSRLTKALEKFRFSQAGIINHLERSENLIEIVHDFTSETFICTTAGYRLEAAREETEAFEQLEKSLPGLDTGSYYYFRITSPTDKSDTEKPILQELPEGALVAIFRFDHQLPIDKRLKNMAIARHFVERWRAKVDSLKTVRDVVQAISQPYQIKTARAAIMSRNLSHNLGSHSLANFRLFEALGVLNGLSAAPAQSELEAVVNVNHAGDTQPSPIRKGELWNARTRLGTFHSYMQGKMDFIARALGESSSQAEPMFFVNDILRGFLSQTVLLNTLLSDTGYIASDLEFHLTIVHKGEDAGKTGAHVFRGIAKDDNIRHVEFEEEFQQADGTVGQFNDLLVAIPGGMVGRHAFFAFMENFMRNAAKYGSKSRQKGGTEKFIIHMLLEERDGTPGALSLNGDCKLSACYTLTIWDNVSLNDIDNIGRIRKHLNVAIIDDQGKPRPEGHGIQEMKVCAQFLAGGDDDALIFPPDHVNTTKDGHCAGQAYSDYLVDNKDKDDYVEIKERNSLLCYGRKHEAGPDHLAYVLLIQQPRLLGIVDYNSGRDSEVETTKEASVVFYRDIRTLAQKPAYFGLILLRDVSNLEQVLSEIVPLHTALPFRLMIVAENQDTLGEVCSEYEEQDKSVRARIWRWQRKNAAAWWDSKPTLSGQIPKFPMPHNRVRAIVLPEMFSITPGSKPSDFESEKWHKIITQVYDEWLWAFKGLELEKPGPSGRTTGWHLGIGFDRSQQTVCGKWIMIDDKGASRGLGFESKYLTLHLFARQSDKDATRIHITKDGCICPNRSLDSICNDRRAMLVLDNHKKVLAEEDNKLLKESPAVYHPFSGSEQIALFQMLETPPSDPFARAFLVFSIAEALLTRVVVVDERVAQACMQQPDPTKPRSVFRYRNQALQKSRIYPLYSVESEKTDSTPAYFCLLPGQGWDILKQSVSSGLQTLYLIQSEGLTVTPYSHIRPDKRKSRQAAILADGNSSDIPLHENNATGVAVGLQERKSKHQIVFGERIEKNEVIAHPFDGHDFSADFVVIHEGVTDQLKDNGSWCKSAHEELYEIASAVVRTSGRGATSRHLGDHLPFLEFSELSDTVYLQMNKVSLGKSLLALRGGVNK